ncbi:hypothetical protein GCM10029963_75000 [Micromonospora andamanensis]|uniref:hypothetical protein n=1 Tax=Micromonospora andamanensis TaxID=1287068 RepID=UPI001951AF68|nr:hypothetical protein [Micromonospora andamanensis]GIJ42677.1 hypothetical protein Vwe01_60020 [Micromonospora andamanensis]
MSTIARKPKALPLRPVAASLNLSILLNDIVGLGDQRPDDHDRLQLRTVPLGMLVGTNLYLVSRSSDLEGPL